MAAFFDQCNSLKFQGITRRLTNKSTIFPSGGVAIPCRTAEQTDDEDGPLSQTTVEERGF